MGRIARPLALSARGQVQRRAQAGPAIGQRQRAPVAARDVAADRQAWADGSLLTVTTLWPRLQDVSFMDLERVEVPLHQGASPATRNGKFA